MIGHLIVASYLHYVDDAPPVSGGSGKSAGVRYVRSDIICSFSACITRFVSTSWSTSAFLCYCHSTLTWDMSVSIITFILALSTANAFPDNRLIMGVTAFADDSTMLWISACSSVFTTGTL